MSWGEWASARNKRSIRDSIKRGQYSNFSSNLETRMAELYSQFGDTPYWQQFLSNPYLNLPSYFDPKMVSSYNYDYWADFLGTYEQNALTEMQRLERLAYEEKYNTPLEQVKREQIAGLNPNLSGNIEPGQASEGTELPVPSLPSLAEFQAQKFSQGTALFDAGQAFVGTVFQLAGNIQGLQQGSIDKATSELGLLVGSDSFAKNFRINHSDLFPEPSGTDDEGNIATSINAALKSALGDTPLSRKSRKYVSRALGEYVGNNKLGVQAGIEDLLSGFVRNRWTAAEGMSKQGWSNDFIEMIGNVSDDYSKLAYDIYKKQQELQQSIIEYQTNLYKGYADNGVAEKTANFASEKLKNELSYERALAAENIPARRVSSESSSLSLKQLQDDIKTFQTKAIRQMEQEIDGIASKYLSGDKWFHVLGRIALPILRSLVSQSIMNYTSAAMQSLGHMSVSGPAPAPVTYDYSTRDTKIFNNPIAE